MFAKYYNYGVKHILSKDLALLQNIESYKNIVMCVYIVNTYGKIPFLQFMLTTNGNESLTLPRLPVNSLLNKKNIIPYSEVYLSGILQSNKFEEFSNNIMFDGSYEYDDDLYLFFDITNCNLNVDETYLTTHIRFGLIDEIVNHKSICNIKIDDITSTFFIKNQSVIYLYDKNNKPYEIPVVGFVGKSTEQKIKFVMTFGESAKNKSAILGPYFYFTDFHHAIRHGGWSCDYKPEKNYDVMVTDEKGKYIKGGLIRFALFLGETKYIENSPNEPNDGSLIKKQRISDNSNNMNKERLTLRISDHDGLWSELYNSVYLGKLELDDGSFLEDTPMFVLKEYEQQLPLSYHFIDKTTLGEKYDENDCNYRIV